MVTSDDGDENRRSAGLKRDCSGACVLCRRRIALSRCVCCLCLGISSTFSLLLHLILFIIPPTVIPPTVLPSAYIRAPLLCSYDVTRHPANSQSPLVPLLRSRLYRPSPSQRTRSRLHDHRLKLQPRSQPLPRHSSLRPCPYPRRRTLS